MTLLMGFAFVGVVFFTSMTRTAYPDERPTSVPFLKRGVRACLWRAPILCV